MVRGSLPRASPVSGVTLIVTIDCRSMLSTGAGAV
jgi:hypothetical protein